ncbi:MAG: SOS response-associated peptidase [Gaiellales bacterium]|nr:MAG: SOS response-associated peptidase [Gaiellales bacterium]
MCGRFTPIPRPQVLEDISRELGIDVAEAVGAPPEPEGDILGPGQCLPFRDIDALHAADDGRIILRPMQWQLIHGWNREFRSDYTSFNTRVEKLDRPHNRELLIHRRCIVPVREFFENRKEGGRAVRPRESYHFTLKGRAMIPLGGIYSIWTNPEDADDRRYSCSVITMEPNELIAEIHNRMPFILPREDVATWLDPGMTDFGVLLDMIGPYDPQKMSRERE